MKCFVSMLLIVIMLLSLSGCGAKIPTPPSVEALAQTDATFASEENSTDPTVVEASDADMLTKEKLSVLAQKGDLDEMRHLITTVKD